MHRFKAGGSWGSALGFYRAKAWLGRICDPLSKNKYLYTFSTPSASFATTAISSDRSYRSECGHGWNRDERRALPLVVDRVVVEVGR